VDRRYDVVVVGKANVDYLVRGPGCRSRASRSTRAVPASAGWQGANQAVGAARLGARVALVARVGNDVRGDSVVEALITEGVEIEHLIRDASEPTGVALCQVGGTARSRSSPPRARTRPLRRARRAAGDALRSTRVLLVQLGVPLAAVAEAIRIGRSAGARVVLDPGPPAPLDDELLAQIDSSVQLQRGLALTGVRVVAATRRARRRCCTGAARQRCGPGGEDGDLLSWSEDEVWLPRFEVARLDATGAGDAFASAFAVALAEGRSLREAGPFASAAAALHDRARRAGSLPRRDAVLALLHHGRSTCHEVRL